MDIIFAQKIVFYEIKKKNWKERTRGKIIKNINIRFNKKEFKKKKLKDEMFALKIVSAKLK